MDNLLEQNMIYLGDRRADRAGLMDSAHHLDLAPVEPIGGRSPHGLPCHVHDPDLWFSDSPAELERAKA